jgi:hypothetical protein
VVALDRENKGYSPYRQTSHCEQARYKAISTTEGLSGKYHIASRSQSITELSGSCCYFAHEKQKGQQMLAVFTFGAEAGI